jgi:hypothetical protein
MTTKLKCDGSVVMTERVTSIVDACLVTKNVDRAIKCGCVIDVTDAEYPRPTQPTCGRCGGTFREVGQ